jgi:phosphoenolpyruvate-protein kinase (PTS system EI component)
LETEKRKHWIGLCGELASEEAMDLHIGAVFRLYRATL